MSGLSIDIDLRTEGANNQLKNLAQRLEGLKNTQANVNVSTSGVKEARAAVQRNMKDLFKVDAAFSASSRKAQVANAKTADSFDGVTAALKRLSGALLAVGGLSFFAKTADNLASMQSRLAIVEKDTAGVERAYTRLFKIASDARGAIEPTIDTYVDFSKSLRRIGISQERIFRVIETLQKGAALSGGSVETIRAGFVQLNQGIASGTLRGEELNSVLEQMKYLGQGLMTVLNKDAGSLRKFAEEGKLTSKLLVETLEKLEAPTASDFDRRIERVEQTLQRVRQSLSRFAGDANMFLGSNQALIKRLNVVVEGLDSAYESYRIGMQTALDSVRNRIRSLLSFNTFRYVIRGMVKLEIAPSDILSVGWKTYKLKRKIDKYTEKFRDMLGIEVKPKKEDLHAQYLKEQAAKAKKLGQINRDTEMALPKTGIEKFKERWALQLRGLMALAEAVRVTFVNIARAMPVMFGPVVDALVTGENILREHLAQAYTMVAKRLNPLTWKLRGYSEALSGFLFVDTRKQRAWAELFTSRNLTEFVTNLERLNKARLGTVGTFERRKHELIRQLQYPLKELRLFKAYISKHEGLFTVVSWNSSRRRHYVADIKANLKLLWDEVFKPAMAVPAAKIIGLYNAFHNAIIIGAQVSLAQLKVKLQAIMAAALSSLIDGPLFKKLTNTWPEKIGYGLGKAIQKILLGIRSLLKGLFSGFRSSADDTRIDWTHVVSQIFSGFGLAVASFFRGFRMAFQDMEFWTDMFGEANLARVQAGLNLLSATFDRALEEGRIKLQAVRKLVVDFATTVKREFFDIYDKVVGHSYWPDMLDGVLSETRKLDAVSAKVAKFAQGVNDRFNAVGIDVRGSFVGFTQRVKDEIARLDLDNVFYQIGRNIGAILIAGIMFAFGTGLARVFAVGHFVSLLNAVLDDALVRILPNMMNSVGDSLSVFAEHVGHGLAHMVEVIAASAPKVVKGFAVGAVSWLDPIWSVLEMLPIFGTLFTNKLLNAIALLGGAWALFTKNGMKSIKQLLTFGESKEKNKKSKSDRYGLTEALLAGMGFSKSQPAPGTPKAPQFFRDRKLAALSAGMITMTAMDSVSWLDAFSVATPLMTVAILGKDGGARLTQDLQGFAIGFFKKLANLIETNWGSGILAKSLKSVFSGAALFLSIGHKDPKKAPSPLGLLLDSWKWDFAEFKRNLQYYAKGQIDLQSLFETRFGRKLFVGAHQKWQAYDVLESWGLTGGKLEAAFNNVIRTIKSSMPKLRKTYQYVFGGAFTGQLRTMMKRAVLEVNKGLVVLRKQFLAFGQWLQALGPLRWVAIGGALLAFTGIASAADEAQHVMLSFGQAASSAAGMTVAFTTAVTTAIMLLRGFAKMRTFAASSRSGLDRNLRPQIAAEVAARYAELPPIVLDHAGTRKLREKAMAGISGIRKDKRAQMKDGRIRPGRPLDDPDFSAIWQSNLLNYLTAQRKRRAKLQRKRDSAQFAETEALVSRAVASKRDRGAEWAIFLASIKDDLRNLGKAAAWSALRIKDLFGMLSAFVTFMRASFLEALRSTLTSFVLNMKLALARARQGQYLGAAKALVGGVALAGFTAPFAVIADSVMTLVSATAGAGRVTQFITKSFGGLTTAGTTLVRVLKNGLLTGLRLLAGVISGTVGLIVGAVALLVGAAIGFFGPAGSFRKNFEWFADYIRGFFGKERSTRGGRETEIKNALTTRIVNGREISFLEDLNRVDFGKMNALQYKVLLESAKTFQEATQQFDETYTRQGFLLESQLQEQLNREEEMRKYLARLPQHADQHAWEHTKNIVDRADDVDNSSWMRFKRFIGGAPILNAPDDGGALNRIFQWLVQNVNKGAVTGAGIGGAVGLFGGPAGAAIGVAVGAAVGFIVSKLTWAGKQVADGLVKAGNYVVNTPVVKGSIQAVSGFFSDIGKAWEKAKEFVVKWYMDLTEATPEVGAKARTVLAHHQVEQLKDKVQFGTPEEIKNLDKLAETYEIRSEEVARLRARGFSALYERDFAEFHEIYTKAIAEREKARAELIKATSRLHTTLALRQQQDAVEKKFTKESDRIKTLTGIDFGKAFDKFYGDDLAKQRILEITDTLEKLSKEKPLNLDARVKLNIQREALLQELKTLEEQGAANISLQARLTFTASNSMGLIDEEALKRLQVFDPASAGILQDLAVKIKNVTSEFGRLGQNAPTDKVRALWFEVENLKEAFRDTVNATGGFEQLNKTLQSLGVPTLEVSDFASKSVADVEKLVGSIEHFSKVAEAAQEAMRQPGAAWSSQIAATNTLTQAVAALKGMVTGVNAELEKTVNSLGVSYEDFFSLSDKDQARFAAEAPKIQANERALKAGELVGDAARQAIRYDRKIKHQLSKAIERNNPYSGGGGSKDIFERFSEYAQKGAASISLEDMFKLDKSDRGMVKDIVAQMVSLRNKMSKAGKIYPNNEEWFKAQMDKFHSLQRELQRIQEESGKTFDDKLSRIGDGFDINAFLRVDSATFKSLDEAGKLLAKMKSDFGDAAYSGNRYELGRQIQEHEARQREALLRSQSAAAAMSSVGDLGILDSAEMLPDSVFSKLQNIAIEKTLATESLEKVAPAMRGFVHNYVKELDKGALDALKGGANELSDANLNKIVGDTFGKLDVAKVSNTVRQVMVDGALELQKALIDAEGATGDGLKAAKERVDNLKKSLLRSVGVAITVEDSVKDAVVKLLQLDGHDLQIEEANRIVTEQAEQILKLRQMLDELREKLKKAAAGDKADIQKQIDVIQSELEETIRAAAQSASESPAAQSARAFASATVSGISDSIKDVLKGKTSVLDGIMALVDKFTNAVIDTFVDGLMQKLLPQNGKGMQALMSLGASIFEGPSTKKEGGSSVSDAYASMLDKDSWIYDFLKMGKEEEKGIHPYADVFADMGGSAGSSWFSDLFKSIFSSFSSGLGSLFSMFKFAEGGHVRGPGHGTSDSIPAMLSNGEFVVNAAATRANLGLLRAINSGRVAKFATGGLVGGTVTPVPVGALPQASPASGGTGRSTVVNLQITGDISRQTRNEIYGMLPQIANGVNAHNREKGIR